MKVLGFDSWTGGVNNFARINAALQADGHALRVIHLGSWGADPGHPSEETIHQVAYRDVSYYHTRDFRRILDEERPDVVLFLSTNTFAHRSFNRYCRERSIPTLHLYHGLVTVQETGGAPQYRINPLAQLRFVVERIPKSLIHTWPNYLNCLLRTGGRLPEYLRFVQELLLGAVGKKLPTASPDALTDVCCVYTEADVPHAMQFYGFDRDHVMTVGNPDLQKFGLEESLIASAVKKHSESREIIYIDTGLIFTGYVYSSREEFIQHLVETKKALAQQGMHMTLKPHPDHLRTDMPARLAEHGIPICSNEELIPLLQTSRAVIAEPSSLTMIPTLMGMPLLLADYGPLQGQRYGTVLLSYPKSAKLTDIMDFTKTLASIEQTEDGEATRAWIDHNAGPLPSGDMPARVVKLMGKLLSDNPTQGL